MKGLLKFLLVCLVISKLYSIRQVYFREMNFDCILKNTFNGMITDTSIVQCAFQCKLAYRHCSRFSWDPVTRNCVFSSNKYITGEVFNISRRAQSFVIATPDCMAVNYDNDFETNTCLKIITLNDATWFDARTRCQEDGGDLITITTKKKYDFVFNYMKCRDSTYIGVKSHVWVSGATYHNDFDIFSQLNSYDGEFGGDGGPFCGVLKTGSPSIVDYSCRFSKHTPTCLCEIKMTNVTER